MSLTKNEAIELLDKLQQYVRAYDVAKRNDPMCVELGEIIKLLQLEYPEGSQPGNCVKNLRSCVYHMCEMSKPGLIPEPPNHTSRNKALDHIEWLRNDVLFNDSK